MILRTAAILLLIISFAFTITTEDIKTTPNQTYKINLIKSKGNVVKLIGKPPISSTANIVSYSITSTTPSKNIIKVAKIKKEKKPSKKTLKYNKPAVNIPTKDITANIVIVASSDIKTKNKKEIIIIKKPIAVYRKKTLIDSQSTTLNQKETLINLAKSMTPEESYHFQTMLVAKNFQPVDERFFNNMGFGLDIKAQFINPQALNNIYEPVFGKINSSLGILGNLRYKLDKNSALGLDVGGFFTNSSKVVANVYEELYLRYGIVNIVYDQKLLNFDGFVLNASAGFGLVFGGYVYVKTDESIATPYTYVKDRAGTGLDFTLALQPRLRINKIWDVGIDVGYLWGKITELKKANVIDTTAPELDFTGFYVGFISTLNL